MLATFGPLPGSRGWAFEFKWDGMRAVCTVAGGRLRILSRSGRDVTTGYPELAELTDLVGGRDVVLDGEIVALEAAGRPSFGLLQRRMHVAAPAPSLVTAVPVVYYAFDLLRLDGEPTVGLPYQRRRELLDGLNLSGTAVRVPPHFPDTDGERVLRAAQAYGLEGVVAKRLDSTYQPGRRSPSWVKVPLVRTEEVVVIGYTAGSGRRAGTLGSLLLAVPDATDRLRYAGHVGTGFTDAALRDLHRRLLPLRRETPPADDVPREHARGAQWVEPVLVGEVAHRAWTEEGVMRAPSWRGLRPDVPAGAGTAAVGPRPLAAGPRRLAAAGRRVTGGPAADVEAAMATPDGRWRVEVVRAGINRWYRVAHGGNTIDWLTLPDVERVLAGAGVDIRTLHEVPAA